MAKTSLPAFTHTLARGEYRSAQSLAEGQIGRHNTPEDLLWNLQAGSLDRLLKQYASSNKHFDQAEETFAHFDQQFAVQKSAQTSLGILLNDSALPYIGKNHDRILVNAYKALNYATLGDFANARVEFNRALYRQNEAKALFADEAEDLKNNRLRDDDNLDGANDVVRNTLNNPKLQEVLHERYKNLDQFEIFTNFVNPFPTYIAGLFFWLQGDTEKAVDILKEAYAMSPGHPVIADNFARAVRREFPSDELWIIYENGLAPEIEETRLDIPVFLNDGVLYVGAAFPKLTSTQQAAPSLFVSTSSGTTTETEPLADMDAVLAAEFKKELPGITFREVTRVALKTYFQYRMQRNYGIVGGIASGLYQATTTGVDIRSWTALPKNFQLAHMAIPSDRQVTLRTPDAPEQTIIIPSDCRNVILYIRHVSSDTDPVHDFIKF